MPAALRSTITKQFDCWIRIRSRLEVGGRRYSPVRMVYQPALWFSISEMVPSGESHFSSALLVLVLLPPAAAPVTTVLAPASPIFMLVVSQPDSSTAAATATMESWAIFMVSPREIKEICGLEALFFENGTSNVAGKGIQTTPSKRSIGRAAQAVNQAVQLLDGAEVDRQLPHLFGAAVAFNAFFHTHLNLGGEQVGQLLLHPLQVA